MKTMNLFIQENKKRLGSKYLANETGFALGVTLMLMVVLALFIVAATQMASQDITRTRTYTQDRASFYIAEAGIQRAVNFMDYDGAGNSPGASANGFNDELNGATWPAAFANTAFANGNYTVTIADNDDEGGGVINNLDIDDTVILTSTGTRNGVSTTIEAVIHRPTIIPASALTTNGTLNGNGTFTVQGACGSIHSNSDFDQSGGSGTVVQGVTASGTCSGGECESSGVLEQEIPEVDPQDYKDYADFVLQLDGTIRDTQSTPNDLTDDIVYTKTGSNWVGNPGAVDGNPSFGSISQPGGLWKMNGTDLADGMYYVEKDPDPTVLDGNIKVLGTPDPFQVTILAEGYIDFGGNGDIVNYQGGPSPDIDQLFLIAGTDLKFTGHPTNQIEGMLYAGEQMSISGDVDLNGYIFSANLADDENLVGPESSISGTLTITYSCNGILPIISDFVSILSWQES